VSFAHLWASYPDEDQPCVPSNDEPTFENQCAIRMGIALENAGFDMSSYPGARCWHGHNSAHIIRAQELADWLDQVCPAVSAAEKLDPMADNIQARQGIIFCRNFWGTYNEGDHIDLWDGFEMRHGEVEYISKSEEIWFWEISD